MRVKSEAKRQAIIDVAAQVFGELGFERTSMSEICARVGGSKATLYNYFASKEALFLEVMTQSLGGEFEMIYARLEAAVVGDIEDVSGVLRDVGRRLLRLLFSPELLPTRRLVITESGRSDLGRLVYEHGPKRNCEKIAVFLTEAMRQGRLREADASVAAWHLLALLQSELLEPFMMGVQHSVSDDEIDACARRAVDVFMRAYGPAGAGA